MLMRTAVPHLNGMSRIYAHEAIPIDIGIPEAVAMLKLYEKVGPEVFGNLYKKVDEPEVVKF